MLHKLYHRLKYGHKYAPIHIKKTSRRFGVRFQSKYEACANCWQQRR